MDLSLVLDQEGIDHELRSVGDEQWALLSEDQDAGRAEAAVAAFERENPVEGRTEPVRSTAGAVACGLVFFFAVLTMHVWTGPGSAASPWFPRGSADAAAILRGEWWRAVTALTLHEDASHAVGNAVLGGLLLALLARSIGPGMARVVVLLAGVAGTFAAAGLLRQNFVSIGASTAAFGALGSLAALPRQRRRAWLPLGGGLALLAFLGTSKRADLAGHLCGFVCGLLLGAAPSLLPPPQDRAAQAVLAVAAGSVPVVGWLAAV